MESGREVLVFPKVPLIHWEDVIIIENDKRLHLKGCIYVIMRIYTHIGGISAIMQLRTSCAKLTLPRIETKDLN